MQISSGDWKQVIKHLYNRKNIINYELSLKAVQQLGYADFYRHTTVVDMYPGVGVFSAAVYNTIRPEKHIMMEPLVSYNKYLRTLSAPGLLVDTSDPFRWTSFTKLEKAGHLKPETQPRSQINNSLLVVGNLTHNQGEQLTAQYLNCITNRSWLEKYGRVRLLLWVRSSAADKLLAKPSEILRNRLAVQCETYCETKLVVSPSASLNPGLVDERKATLAETALLDLDMKTDVLSKGASVPLSLVELTPKNEHIEHAEELEYVTKMLFILRTKPLSESLSSLGPGAPDDLREPLKDIIHKQPVNMTVDEFKRVAKAFWEWPFKPDIRYDFYEEQSLGNGNAIGDDYRL